MFYIICNSKLPEPPRIIHFLLLYDPFSLFSNNSKNWLGNIMSTFGTRMLKQIPLLLFFPEIYLIFVLYLSRWKSFQKAGRFFSRHKFIITCRSKGLFHWHLKLAFLFLTLCHFSQSRDLCSNVIRISQSFYNVHSFQIKNGGWSLLQPNRTILF